MGNTRPISWYSFEKYRQLMESTNYCVLCGYGLPVLQLICPMGYVAMCSDCVLSWWPNRDEAWLKTKLRPFPIDEDEQM